MDHSNDIAKAGGNICGLCCTRITNLSVSFGKTEILNDINLHIHCGELTAFIGPNGAGKSTLLKAILGEIKHSGKMEFLDMKGNRTGNPLMGYVPQHLDFDKSSPVSVVDLFMSCLTNTSAWLVKSNQRREQITESLKVVQGEHLIDKGIGDLSGGELQRVMLALALVPLPDLLLLDEPVSKIDQNGLEMFYKIVSDLRNNYDMSIILVSHDFNLVHQYADRVVLINKTLELNGKPEEVFNDDKLTKVFRNMLFKKQNASSAKQISKDDKET